ncbi:hypothetical protein CVD28_00055 [Bacillus sp. M6-12]|uniref:hypothetical protein n=1 Tax=Bacillus sp. M6-12 TaxID=2054166 RepID=UPI000C7764E8|nr:hypothetical protein [Bacillus sp. M6-12]PLS18829.1 hypothetical protein CVD28_00055 [Bacillus sp. M6-12]
MLKTLMFKEKKIDINTCIYKEDKYFLIDIGKELVGHYILSNAICNGVLNLNALYKNFIDDNFEYDTNVQDHQIEEIPLENGSTQLVMLALDQNHRVIRSHTIELKSK